MDLDAFLAILQEYNVNEEEGSKMILHMTGAMKIK
jgi:hypothetical protein